MSMKLKVLLATYVYSLNIQKYCRKRILCTSTYVLHILIKCVFSILDTNVLCSFNFKPQSTKVNGRIYFKNDTKDRIFTVFNKSHGDTLLPFVSVFLTQTLYVYFDACKGHLISKCPFSVLKWTKNQQIFCKDFCPSL